MSHSKKRIQRTLFFSLLLVLLSCEQKQGDVQAEVVPEGPVVIDATYEYISAIDGEKTTVEPPWFSLKLKAKNNNREKTISIVAVKLKVKGLKNGTATEGTVDFTGIGDANDQPVFDTNCNGTTAPTDTTDKLGFLFELIPGQGCISNLTLYAGDLPEDDDFKYDIEATFIGWYNKFDSGQLVPDERLEVVWTFSTR